MSLYNVKYLEILNIEVICQFQIKVIEYLTRISFESKKTLKMKLINTKEFLSLIQMVHFSPSSSFSSSSSSSGSSEFSLGLFSSSSSCFLFCSSFFFFLFSFLFSLLAARACFLLSSLDCE